jgi:hypothetical protein
MTKDAYAQHDSSTAQRRIDSRNTKGKEIYVCTFDMLSELLCSRRSVIKLIKVLTLEA